MRVRTIIVVSLALGLVAHSAATLLATIELPRDPMQATHVERAPSSSAQAPSADETRAPRLPQHRLGPSSNRRVLRGQILLAFRNHRASLDECLPKDRASLDSALVSLEVSVLDGATRIEDVTFVTEGETDPDMVACAQAALRGTTLSTPGTVANAKRTRVVFRIDSY